jgi:hypothetical protein
MYDLLLLLCPHIRISINVIPEKMDSINMGGEEAWNVLHGWVPRDMTYDIQIQAFL